MKKKVYVVPHSHWDREWYFTLEDSNILLGENLNFLIEYLENNNEFKSYTFDAQASILEEFVSNFPEEKERLKTLIANKRIFVGPWYTQTDSLLVNKESVIRNLLYGIKISESYGHSMNIGYLPDIFGQNAYLPSIFKNFGIDYSIFQRGIYTDELRENLNINWESPDGEIIKANNIYLGYGPGKFLSSSDEYIKEKLLPMLEKLSKLNKDSNSLLLPSGGDQVLIRTHFPKTIKEINEKLENYELILSNYEEFMEKTWNNSLISNKISGELRGTEKSRIHRTIGSSRYDIKKLNTEVENKILNILEPLAVMGEIYGIKYPKTWLDKAWKLLFDVHAHDSIGGCNSDETNENIIHRLKKVDRIVDNLLNLLKKKIVFLISKEIKKKNIFVLFNLDIKQTFKGYEVILFTNEKNFEIEDLKNNILNAEILEQEYISGGKQIIATAKGDQEVELPGYYRSKIYFERDIKGISWEAFIVKESKNEEIGKFNHFLKSLNEMKIGNKFLSIELKNNKLILTNLKTKEKIENFLSFEDTRDFGDTYDYSPLKDDYKILSDTSEFIKSKKGENIEELSIKNILNLPKKLGSIEFEKLEIVTTLELRENEKFVRVKHVLKNNIEDHRLRVILNIPFKNIETSYSNSGFSLISHPVLDKRYVNWRENGYVEAPISVYNMENFSCVKNENQVFGAITCGIKEYEANDDKLILTLFRSVGLLGRDNLVWRPGRASGINNKIVYTPKSQLLQELSFNYAITWTEVERDSQIYDLIDRYIGREASYHLQSLNTFEENLERFEIPYTENMIISDININYLNKNIILSSLKKSYDNNEYILRVFNPGEKIETINFENYEVFETNLKEEKIKKVLSSDIKPKGYKTFSIKLKKDKKNG